MAKSLADLPQRYRAWTWRGGAEPADLELAEVAAILPGRGDALVRNAAIGLNPVDWKVIAAATDWRPGHIPGVDAAGVVVALGDGVDESLLGARVAYHQSLSLEGTFAEYAAPPARALMRLPDDVDFAAAASFPCPALTAELALDKIPLRAGAKLLLSGAGGAVGHYALQIAVKRGFAVTALCHPRHRERLMALGARDLLPGPLEPGEIFERPGEYDAVIDSVGADHAGRLAPTLAANGHMVCIQGRLPTWPDEPFGRAISLHEVALGALHRFGDNAAWARLVAAGEALLRDLAAGRLQPEALRPSAFEDLPAALGGLKQRHFSGKPVIAVG